MQNTHPYFESQGSLSLYCGLHSVNNMLGYKAYSKQGMNNICYGLSDNTINPHKHILGGEYDANVLINALQNKGGQVDWHDNRLPLSIRFEAEKKEKGELMGFLLNSGTGKSIFNVLFKLSGRHWFTVKKLGEKYYLLDPSTSGPALMGGPKEAEQWLNKQRQNGSEILVVRKVGNM